MVISAPGVVGVADPSLTEFGLPDDDVLDALVAGIVRIRRRVEIYENDAVTPFDIPNWNARLVEGEVTVDRSRDERRMCDISLDNTDKALKNDPLNGFWYDKILKVFWGIRYFDSFGVEKSWETQIGEFMIDRIDEDHFPHVTKVTGRDYTKKCLNSKLQYSLSFPPFTPIENIVQSLAANAGISKFALPITGQTYNTDIVFSRGTERFKVMQQVAATIGYEVYFMPNGYLTMRPIPDPSISPLKWIFAGGDYAGTDGTLVKYKRSANDTNIFNHVVVVGTTDALPGSGVVSSSIQSSVYAEKMNTDAASPTNINRIGDRVKIYESDYITEQLQADNLATQLLAVNSLEEYQVDFESVVLPWLEAGDIVGIVDDPDDTPYTPNRFLLSNFTLPLRLGTMSGVGRRVTIVGTTQNLEFQ
jgi:hypothetical protein